MQTFQIEPKSQNTETATRVGVHFMHNLKQAETFYRDIMGFSLKERFQKTLVFQADNLDLYIVKAVSSDPAGILNVNGFESPSELLRTLEHLGCHVDTRSDGALYFNDPNGVMETLMRYNLPDPCLHN